jgi:hypothetical protein
MGWGWFSKGQRKKPNDKTLTFVFMSSGTKGSRYHVFVSVTKGIKIFFFFLFSFSFHSGVPAGVAIFGRSSGPLGQLWNSQSLGSRISSAGIQVCGPFCLE